MLANTNMENLRASANTNGEIRQRIRVISRMDLNMDKVNGNVTQSATRKARELIGTKANISWIRNMVSADSNGKVETRI